MVENLPVNAGDTGSTPHPGSPTNRGAAKPCTTRTEPVLKSVGATTSEKCGGY